MPAPFETAIAAHASRARPLEACGLVLRAPDGAGLEIQETENVATDPENFFAISPEVFLQAKQTGRLLGYYHSHPFGDHEPSPQDIAVAAEVGLPCFVYGWGTKLLNVHVPESFRAPLEGRPFTPMLFDCVSLVWDYFRDVARRPLPFLPRTQSDYSHGMSFDFRALIESEGARIVAEPRQHDILVFALHGSARPNHLGVHVGLGQFLHQTRDGSRRDVFGGFWRQRFLFAVRVPGIQAPPIQENAQDGAPVRAEGTK